MVVMAPSGQSHLFTENKAYSAIIPDPAGHRPDQQALFACRRACSVLAALFSCLMSVARGFRVLFVHRLWVLDQLRTV